VVDVESDIHPVNQGNGKAVTRTVDNGVVIHAEHSETSMQISHLDHLVLTVRDIPTSLDFYSRVLGMQPVVFGQGRNALAFGNQKINLHQLGAEFEPKASFPLPGSADLCFIVKDGLETVIEHIHAQGVSILEGPVERTGAMGPIRSIYLFDPDLNLIELSNLVENAV
jgi:catechol 2,3-dioxygenase-like lactoylglutathione lyase family enzyme